MAMKKGDDAIIIPNPHPGDIGVGLPARILQQAQIDRDAWIAAE